jgi:CRISPR-associated protein Csb2
MAMAAAHYESGADPVERAALEWIERQEAPAIQADEGYERTTVKAYVPVNDDAGNIVARSRQDRVFPKIRLESDTAYLMWRSEAASEVRDGLERLCPKVTRIGHSSSLVQMWVVAPGEELEPNWLPSTEGSERMRVASSGSLASLEADFNEAGFRRLDALRQELQTAKGKAKATLKRQIEQEFPDGQPSWRRPQIAKWQGYAPGLSEVTEAVTNGPFDSSIIVLAKQEGRNLGLEATLQLTTALRNAAMKAASREGVAPEWVSGHAPDGSPSLRPHLAFFPLAFVGDAYADGHVMGVAMAVPRDLQRGEGTSKDAAIRNLLGPLFFDPETGEEEEIAIWNRYWKWTLDRERREHPPLTLRADTWTRPSRTWASVTPMVLHHYPKRSRPGDVERIVREAFVSALLPEPEEIIIRSVSRFTGAGDARSMPLFDEGGTDLCKYQTHVVVRFRNKLSGPALVGRGRYKGYGLFRPYDEREDYAD